MKHVSRAIFGLCLAGSTAACGSTDNGNVGGNADSDDQSAGSIEQAQVVSQPTNAIVGFYGKCLSVEGSAVNGARIVMRTCDGGADQQWHAGPVAGQIQGINNKCLNAQGGASANGTQLILYTCSTGVANEVWNIGAKVITGIGGKCLNVHGGVPNDGTPVTLWSCVTDANNEKFVFQRTRTTIRVHAVFAANTDGKHPLYQDGVLNGEAPQMTPQEFKSMIDDTNSIYAPTGIQFAFSAASTGGDWTEVKSDALNLLEEKDCYRDSSGVQEAIRQAAYFPGKLTVILSDRYVAGGCAPFDRSYVTFASRSSGIGPTLAHEFGHHLGLPHTHSFDGVNARWRFRNWGWDDNKKTYTVPLDPWTPANFDNDAGTVNDTPPDPGAGTYPPGFACSTDLTINGVTFAPDKSNMMSYWGNCDPAHPLRRSITPDQIARMQGVLAKERAGLAQDANPKQIRGFASATSLSGAPQVFATAAGGVYVKSKVDNNANAALTVWTTLPAGPSSPQAISAVNFNDKTEELFVVSAGQVQTIWNTAAGTWSNWNAFSPGFTTVDLATTRTSDGRARVWALGSGGQIAVNQKTAVASGSAWGGWTTVFGPSGTTLSRLTVSVLPDGREEIFGIGNDQKLYTAWQVSLGGAFSAWVNMTAPLARDVEAGYTTNGRPQLFLAVSSGGIQATAKVSLDANSAWSAWSAISESKAFTSVGYMRLTDGRAEVMGEALGVPFTAWDTGSSWSSWLPL